jgi:preprotein translocase SecE subunit
MERVKALIAATRAYFREVLGELSKVMWPDVQRTAKLTGIVVGLVVIVVVYIFVLDFPLSYGLSQVVAR